MMGAMMLFLVTEKLPISDPVRMRDDDITGNFCIANEGNSEQGGKQTIF